MTKLDGWLRNEMRRTADEMESQDAARVAAYRQALQDIRQACERAGDKRRYQSTPDYVLALEAMQHEVLAIVRRAL